MKLEVLDSATWRKALEQLPKDRWDAYFTFEYHEAHATEGSGRPYGAWVSEGNAGLLITGLRRPIEAKQNDIQENTWDLQTCNGYGGPLVTPGAPKEFLAEAWARWREMVAADGCVAAFFRMHPFLSAEADLPVGSTVCVNRSTVAVNLGLDGKEQLAASSSGHRGAIRKFEKWPGKACWDSDWAWQGFETLYGRAMERLCAPEELRFGKEYFRRLRSVQGVHVIVAVESNEAVAGVVTFFCGTLAHYHLGARSASAGSFVMNGLLQTIFDRARASGIRTFHMGGGRTPSPDDSLLKFKMRLGGGVCDFRVARVVTSDPVFKALETDWERRNGRTSKWLLPYREPLGDSRGLAEARGSHPG